MKKPDNRHGVDPVLRNPARAAEAMYRDAVRPMVTDRKNPSRRVEGWTLAARLLERDPAQGVLFLAEGRVRSALKQDELSPHEAVRQSAQELRDLVSRTMSAAMNGPAFN